MPDRFATLVPPCIELPRDLPGSHGACAVYLSRTFNSVPAWRNAVCTAGTVASAFSKP